MIRLSQSYRCPPHALAAAQALLEKVLFFSHSLLSPYATLPFFPYIIEIFLLLLSRAHFPHMPHSHSAYIYHRHFLEQAPALSLVPKSAFSASPWAQAPRVLLRAFWDSAQEGRWLADQILAKNRAGLPFSEMAVLVRSQVDTNPTSPPPPLPLPLPLPLPRRRTPSPTTTTSRVSSGVRCRRQLRRRQS